MSEWSPPSFKLPGGYSGYELLCPVGTGRHGSVWMADAPREHPHLACAVKFYLDEALEEPEAADAFLEQARKARAIRGLYLAGVHRALDLRPFRAEGWPAVATVSQLLEPSLERVLADLAARSERLPAVLVTSWARQLFEAVESLHSARRYVHGHIKPSNILLRLSSGRAYRDLASLDGAEALLGDLAGACPSGTAWPDWWPQDEEWSAPELSERTLAVATPAEDLYALGLVLQRLAAAAEGEPAALSDAARGLAGVDPEGRLAAKRELRDLLFPASETVAPSWEQAVILRQSEAQSGHPHTFALTSHPGTAGGAPWLEFVGVRGYTILRPIGSGGMGLVYEGYDVALNRPVAIKTIQPQVGRGTRERFRLEATALARLSHPNIVQIYGAGDEGGRGYLIEELVRGPSLHQLVQSEGPLPAPEAARIGQALAEAVAFAHDCRVLHRDIKPSNVLLTPEGIPKLIDFGLAKLTDADAPQLTMEGSVMGTVAFMAPEQMRGEPVDTRTDVFGLGGTIYYLLTQRSPRQGRTVFEMCQQVEQPVVHPREYNPEVPAALEEICLRCLAFRPEDRPQASQVAEQLARFRASAGASPYASVAAWLRRLWRGNRTSEAGASPPSPAAAGQRPAKEVGAASSPSGLLPGSGADQASLVEESSPRREEAMAQERLHRDLELARQVQLSFLPRPPALPGYEVAACSESHYPVGGDFFDFIPLPDGRLAVCIADVAGRGLPAALLASRFSLAARFCLGAEADPARAVGKLNALVHETVSPYDRFITFVLAVLDPRTHELTLVNAGHVSPLIYCPGASDLRQAMPRSFDGVPLGILKDFPFAAFKTTLAPGECLLLLTDGVIDAADGEHHNLGTGGLTRAIFAAEAAHGPLSAQTLVDGVVRAAKEHTAGRGLNDDMTLVVLQRSPSEK